MKLMALSAIVTNEWNWIYPALSGGTGNSSPCVVDQRLTQQFGLNSKGFSR
jgi:hypothetical protein